jgi:hypothetical protein
MRCIVQPKRESSQIIKIVGDSTGELADRFHFVGPDEAVSLAASAR